MGAVHISSRLTMRLEDEVLLPLFPVIDSDPDLINIWVERHLIIPPPYSGPSTVTTVFLKEPVGIHLASQV